MVSATYTVEQAPLYFAVFVAGILGSAINTLAGGGSLITFPTMLLFGVPSIPANASNAFGMFPGSLAGAIGLRDRFDKTKPRLKDLGVASLLGGCLGAFLLYTTPQKTFDILVPILTGLATLILALQKRLKAWRDQPHIKFTPQGGWLTQLAVSVYGGYFGAGMGIMMLAAFALFLDGDIHDHNALKGWLGLLINAAASLMFVLQGLIWWPIALSVMAGALIGGYLAGKLGQRIPSEKLRVAIVVYGTVMTLFLIWRVVKAS